MSPSPLRTESRAVAVELSLTHLCASGCVSSGSPDARSSCYRWDNDAASHWCVCGCGSAFYTCETWNVEKKNVFIGRTQTHNTLLLRSFFSEDVAADIWAASNMTQQKCWLRKVRLHLFFVCTLCSIVHLCFSADVPLCWYYSTSCSAFGKCPSPDKSFKQSTHFYICFLHYIYI